MNRQQLRELQAPLKELYLREPERAVATMSARGVVCIEELTCRIDRPPGDEIAVISGLHPYAGGDGLTACSGDMLLQALVACAGVTFAAVATSMELPVSEAVVEATAQMDFRGTLGVSREVPVGMSSIHIVFRLRSKAAAEQLEKLVQLTERYCVIAQTLRNAVPVTFELQLLA
ncbi:MAG: OsmC family protein [Planctomyces sp.]|nr:OsmC family protein [Planctomyces sp.]